MDSMEHIKNTAPMIRDAEKNSKCDFNQLT